MSTVIDDADILSQGEAGNPPAPPPAGSRNLEVEVKFLVNDLDLVRARLASLGAQAGSSRVFERNIRFDTPDEALLARQQLLRLRQDTRVRLTFKGPALEDVASEAKIREEVEITIDDFDQMAVILERLGFAAIQTYEKYRETFHWGDVEIVLDELPFGRFVELEGPDPVLRPAAEALGLDWSRRILANYLALMELARRTFNLPFRDLTFANFEQHPIPMSDLLPVCVLLDAEEP